MNVIELLTSKGIFYTVKGRDYVIKCLNPDHDDKHPSLKVDKTTGMMHCFSCGFKGNIFDHFGEKVNKAILKSEKLKEKISSLLRKNPKLPAGAMPFEIEYRGIKGETYQHFDAFMQSTDEHFVDRLVFPITDMNDDVVGFIGRYMHSDADPKYKVVPSKTKLPMFPAKPEPVQGSIIIVEGIFDMLNLYDKGLPNAVTGFGISRGQLPSWKHARRRHNKIDKVREEFSIYKLQGITRIYVMYDGDEPGQEAADGLIEILSEDFIIDKIEIGKGEDPGEFTAEKVKALRELLYESSDSGQVSRH